MRKKLIVTRKLAQEELIKVKKVVPSELLLLPQYEKNDIEDRRLYTINATVIFVAELDESCSIDSTLMILKNEFIKKNYKIVTVMSKKEGMVVGLPVLPDFVNEHFNDQEQILYFNHFIKKLEELENPDIILIGISGALKNISSNVIGNMGMNVFKVSQAVLPDYVIVNLMISGWKEEYFKILSKDLSIFFRKDVDLFNIEDKVLDIDESENKQDTRYTTVSPEYTEKQIKKLCVKNVVHLSNEEQSSTVVEEIINRLQSYNELGDDYIV